MEVLNNSISHEQLTVKKKIDKKKTQHYGISGCYVKTRMCIRPSRIHSAYLDRFVPCRGLPSAPGYKRRTWSIRNVTCYDGIYIYKYVLCQQIKTFKYIYRSYKSLDPPQRWHNIPFATFMNFYDVNLMYSKNLLM